MPKNQYRRAIDVRRPTIASYAIGGNGGGGGGGGGVTDHSALTGLAADDHPQYVLHTEAAAAYVPVTRTLFADDGLDGGGALTGDVHFSVDGTVVRTSRQVIAGMGMTGGGSLSGDVTLDVVAGDGIVVGVNAVAVVSTIAGNGLTWTAGVIDIVAANASISVTANAIAVNPAIAGFGLGWDAVNHRIDVGAGNGMTVGVDAIAITQPTANLSYNSPNEVNVGGHRHAIDNNNTYNSSQSGLLRATSGAINLDNGTFTTKVVTPYVESSGVSQITLAPAGTAVLPLGSILKDLGDYNRKWRTLHAAELYVETIVAQDVMATIGGRILVAPTTTLIADINASQTTIDVKHNNLHSAGPSGAHIYLSSAPGGAAQIEAMKVANVNPTAITGGYRYTVTRGVDGTPANSWVAGDGVVNTGSAVGHGLIDLTSTNTVYNHFGPTVTVYARNSVATWNALTPVVSMGNLRSWVDYGTDEYGFALGNDLSLPVATFRGMTADRTNGIRLFNASINTYSGGVQVGVWAYTGTIALSDVDISDQDARLFWFSPAGPVMRIGAVGTGKVNLNYTGSALQLRQNLSSVIVLDGATGNSYFAGEMTIAVGGGIWQGTGSFASPTVGLKIWNQSGVGRIAGYSGGQEQWGATTTGVLTAGGGNVVLDITGINILADTTFDLTRAYSFKYGSITMGGLAAYRLGGNDNRLDLKALRGSGYASIFINSEGTPTFPGAIHLSTTGVIGGTQAIAMWTVAGVPEIRVIGNTILENNVSILQALTATEINSATINNVSGVSLLFNGGVKLTTVSIGVDISGTLFADAVTVSGLLTADGRVNINSTGNVTTLTVVRNGNYNDSAPVIGSFSSADAGGDSAAFVIYGYPSDHIDTYRQGGILFYAGSLTPKLMMNAASTSGVITFHTSGAAALANERMKISTTAIEGSLSTLWDTPTTAGTHRWKIAGSGDIFSIGYNSTVGTYFSNFPYPAKFTTIGTAIPPASNSGAEMTLFSKAGRPFFVFKNASGVARYLCPNINISATAGTVAPVQWEVFLTPP